MKKWDVMITATIRKTERVEAETEQEAIEIAHSQFSTLPEKNEFYNEETDSCTEVNNS